MIKEILAPYVNLAKTIGAQVDVPYTLILAIIYKESSGKTSAIRYEPYWKYYITPEKFYMAAGSTVETEIILQGCSFGLMQLMGSVARELGFNGPFPELFQPSVNIYWGAQKLSALVKKYPVLSDAISAYNQGHPEKLSSGDYKNQIYVSYVLKYISSLVQEGI